MKFPDFSYVAAESVDACLRVIDAGEAQVLAGGQSLLPLMALRMAQPPVVVDVSRIPELRFVEETDELLRIGATVKQADLEDRPDIAIFNPLIAKALPLIGHRAIRNRGTVGGSVAHADPAAEWPALCTVLNAQILLRSSQATRSMSAQEYFVGPFMTAKTEEELVVEVAVPSWTDRSGSGFVEVTRRSGDFATLGAMAVLTRGEGQELESAAVCLFGGVATPLRIPPLEQELTRSPRSDWPDVIDTAVELVSFQNDIHAGSNLRRDLARRVLRRVLDEAMEELW